MPYLFFLSLLLSIPPTVTKVPIAEAAPIVLDSTTTVAAYIKSNYSDIPYFYETLKCESGDNPSAIGDQGRSFGVAQIFLPAHSDITKEQALDAKWSVDWAATQFRKGRQRMWTCWMLVKHGNMSE